MSIPAALYYAFTGKEPPITHGGADRGGKLCLCRRCGRTGTCTPIQDYYTLGDETVPLYCEACFVQQYFDKKRAAALRRLLAETGR